MSIFIASFFTETLCLYISSGEKNKFIENQRMSFKPFSPVFSRALLHPGLELAGGRSCTVGHNRGTMRGLAFVLSPHNPFFLPCYPVNSKSASPMNQITRAQLFPNPIVIIIMIVHLSTSLCHTMKRELKLGQWSLKIRNLVSL